MISAVESPKNVFLLVPNLIGYLRIALALFSFYHMPRNALTAGLAYLASALLDSLDGYAARLLNQSSKFGAILDQLTDRCTFLGLLFALCSLYPEYVFVLQIVGVIDVASHWVHLHSSALQNKLSHKVGNTNPVLNVYYDQKSVLFLLCTGNEVFFCLLYLCKFFPGQQALIWILWLTAPVALTKTFINLVQGYVGFQAMADLEYPKKF